MSDSKIQFKVGIIEFSGEGDQDWLSTQLDKIISKVPELLKVESLSPQGKVENNGSTPIDSKSTTQLQLSMTNIAKKMGCKSGQDLVCAAASYLKFVQGKEVFSRNEILTTMKTATGYYKTSYSANLTNMLGGMLKSSLNEPTKDNYSLQATKETELYALLSR